MIGISENNRCEMPGSEATLQWFSSVSTVATVETSEPVPVVAQTALVTARGEETSRILTEFTVPVEEPSGCGPLCDLLVIVEIPEGVADGEGRDPRR